MRIGIVRTVSSPCRCAESVALGLEALGHDVCLADSEMIETEALALAEVCDLVIDHTDTFHGRGLYRPIVRLLLENSGARIVGSDAKACFLADDKAAAKGHLAEAGIPVPPGIVISSLEWHLPEWLRPPLVLKPAFEHMSRGVYVAQTEAEAHAISLQLLESRKQPILVESYISGRELAVSILAVPGGLQVLPPLEWAMNGGNANILTEDFKLMDPVGVDRGMARADLPDKLLREIEDLARQAFHVLDLRDYARFDIRLTPGGTSFFLEANTTPSLEPMEALAVSAQWAGLRYSDLVNHMLSAALRRYESSNPERGKIVRVPFSTGYLDLEIPGSMPGPPESTVELAQMLDIQPGDEVLELGCGAGLLSIAAAKLGAKHVVAVDIDRTALEATKKNALRNGVNDRIEVRAGSWYEALGDSASCAEYAKRFDVIIATPPQTPGLWPFGPKYGGHDGTMHFDKIIQGAPAFLNPVRGRLWVMAISLANTKRILEQMNEFFFEASLMRETQRLFTPAEYEALNGGLFDYLCSLRSSGISDFREMEKDSYCFRNLFIRASRLREI